MRRRMPMLGRIMLVLGMIAPILGTTHAHAAQLTAQGCQVMAIWGRDLVWARDMGADKEKVRAWVAANAKTEPVLEPLASYFDHIWATTGTGVEMMQALYADCAERRGNYGSPT